VAPSIRKSWQSLRRQAVVGIVRSRTQTMEFVVFVYGYIGFYEQKVVLADTEQPETTNCKTETVHAFMFIIRTTSDYT
jgi:hypothetical protein